MWFECGPETLGTYNYVQEVPTPYPPEHPSPPPVETLESQSSCSRGLGSATTYIPHVSLLFACSSTTLHGFAAPSVRAWASQAELRTDEVGGHAEFKSACRNSIALRAVPCKSLASKMVDPSELCQTIAADIVEGAVVDVALPAARDARFRPDPTAQTRARRERTTLTCSTTFGRSGLMSAALLQLSRHTPPIHLRTPLYSIAFSGIFFLSTART